MQMEKYKMPGINFAWTFNFCVYEMKENFAVADKSLNFSQSRETFFSFSHFLGFNIHPTRS